MEDTLKNLLYAGVGLASEASEKIQKEVDKLVEKGKTSDSEAKRIIDEFISKSEEKVGEFEGKFNEMVEKFGYAKSTEVVDLRKKLEELEVKANAKSKSASAPLAAKTTK